jgi:DnaJ-class molecular chaperone
MANYEIRIATGAAKGPRPSNYATWTCPFCHGSGLNPYGKTINERCPACRGGRSFEAEIAISQLSTCGRCAGSGRINYMGNWAACTTCKGSGKV